MLHWLKSVEQAISNATTQSGFERRRHFTGKRGELTIFAI